MPHLICDHAGYLRKVLADPLTPQPVIPLEGILILAEEPLRRLRWDLQHRGRSFESVEWQYVESVRPMHLAMLRQ